MRGISRCQILGCFVVRLKDKQYNHLPSVYNYILDGIMSETPICPIFFNLHSDLVNCRYCIATVYHRVDSNTVRVIGLEAHFDFKFDQCQNSSSIGFA